MAKSRSFTWRDDGNAENAIIQYNMKYGIVPGGPYPNLIVCPVGEGITKSVNLPAATYYFTISAVNIEGEGPDYPEIEVKVYNLPVRVLDLLITVID
jgi:hypothetical protein